MMLYVSAAINLDFDSFFRYFAADMLEKLEKLNVRERQEITGDVPTIRNQNA